LEIKQTVSILPSAAEEQAVLPGVILPLAEPDWLNWSRYKDNTLGFAYYLCNMTQNPKTLTLNRNP